MIMKLSKVESAYEAIDRATIQKITNPTALAIWVYLQSKPSDWVVREQDIRHHFGIGRDRFLKAMKYLRELGLYKYKLVKDDNGVIKSKAFVLYPQAKKTISTENPTLGKTISTENPTLGKTIPLKETKEILNKQRVLKKENTKEKKSKLLEEMNLSTEYEEYAKEFIAYRGKIGKRIKTSIPLKAFIRELDTLKKLGYDLKEAIACMQEREWQTLKYDWIAKSLKPKIKENNLSNSDCFTPKSW